MMLLHLFLLIVPISLVYGATRHEFMRQILENAVRSAVWILGFVGMIFAILLVITWIV